MNDYDPGPDYIAVADGVITKVSNGARLYLESGDMKTVNPDFAEAMDYMINSNKLFDVLALLATSQDTKSGQTFWDALVHHTRLEQIDREARELRQSNDNA